MTTIADFVTKRLEGSIASIQCLLDQQEQIIELSDVVLARLGDGGTLYTCGNGGSAAQAIHLAEELIGRYRDDRPAQRAVCLNSDPAALTCIANDYGFEHIFSRQCEALLTERDALLVLSTSGNSENIVNALRTTRKNGATTLGLLGREGGKCRELCDHCIIVPINDTAHIQEAHQVLLHLICEAIEQSFRS